MGAADAVAEPLNTNPIPPLAVGEDNAFGFNKIVPISGKNQPYEPELSENPSDVVADPENLTP